MTAATFDTHAAVTALRDAGIDEAHAAAIVNTVRDASIDRADLATKGDLAHFATKGDLAHFATKGDLYRALWIQGAGIIAILTALRFFPA